MEKLFSEFEPADAAAWKAQLAKDLKGTDPASLTWHNENGFDIAPYYTAADNTTAIIPAFSHTDWDICVKGGSGASTEINARLLSSLMRGATAISLEGDLSDPDTLLQHIQLPHIHSSFVSDAPTAKALVSRLLKDYRAEQLNSTFIPAKLSTAEDLAGWCQAFTPDGQGAGIRYASADVTHFHNQGALAYYEIAVMFSLLDQFLAQFAGAEPAGGFVVKTGVNADFFVQIAKLRAIRRLWEIFREVYQLKSGLRVICETSLNNKSASDSHSNLLRTTVEAMAAVAGGCNELIVHEFDILTERDNTFSARLAVSQQLILKEEAYLDKIADVGCGSYYIEWLTDMLAEKALGKFREFEKQGGYFSCLHQGIFAAEITEQHERRKQLIASGELPVIGVNKFRNSGSTADLDSELQEHLNTMGVRNPVVEFELGQLS